MVQHLWWYGESSEGVPIQDVRPGVVDEDVGADLVQRRFCVELDFLEVLGVLGAPVQLHLPVNGSWRYGDVTNTLICKKGS